MKTSRQRLFEFVQSQRVTSTDEISRALQMTPANARHHLNILIQQGLVEMVGERPKTGRGRPAQLYCLSSQAIGVHTNRLTSAVMSEWLEGCTEAEKTARLKRLAGRLTGKQAQESNLSASKKPLAQRLNKTIQYLNEQNYQARWEAHAQGPRILLGRCPYASLLPEHPELCQLDGWILEALLEVPVRQTARQVKDPRGLSYCLFLVGVEEPALE